MKPAKAEFGWAEGSTLEGTIFSHRPDRETAETLSKVLNKWGTIGSVRAIYSLNPAQGIAGSYQIETENRSWFLRVSSRIGNAELERGITEYLSSAGVPVNPIVYTKLFRHKDQREYRVDIRPLVHGSHFNGAVEDIIALCITLRLLHEALKKAPFKQRIKKNASHRYRSLNGIRDRLKDALTTGNLDIFSERQAWAAQHLDWLKTLVRGFTPSYHELPGAQPQHGEVHMGNVIFSQGMAILIDFEEAVHVYAPPVWDWAYVVQRFLLWDNPSKGDILTRLRAVGDKIPVSLKEISAMIRQTAWLSMAVIIDLRLHHNVITPVSELEKFVHLSAQADVVENL